MYGKNGGQYGYAGHVINTAQDDATFETSLAWNLNPEDVPIIVIQPPHGGEWEGHHFAACTRRVQHALVYLIARNPGYARVWIDLDRLQREGSRGVDLIDVFLTIEDPDDHHDHEDKRRRWLHGR